MQKFKVALLAITMGCSLPTYAIDNPEALIQQKGTLIYSDTFNQNLSQWVVEKSAVSEVSIKQAALDIDDAAGTTVWFRHSISTPSVIEFDGTVVVAGGPNDRGTDLNFFWMAQEPGSQDFFAKSDWRAGDMRKYDPMQLYYIGYGANDNSTTRFRRYPGDGTRPLLPEFDVTDKQFMNIPNQPTNIKIVSLDDQILVFSNNQKLYEINDEEQFKSGKFGFRTWKSHLKIDNFKVYSLNMEHEG
ncbi:hypothetical protein C9J03_10795 [Photobacterium gaetbulicola]|uniref:DUF6250 domain-containing protein n=1 Tax=Photobacterium gaetbulicola Gung47 TaxID=658445 RepID=A0A0C5WMS1_9GAMM|nr:MULTISPECIES: DUF6250 domain-containing protein [Photobacterium]AJR08433.1 hypothetical protein H744_2c1767 [Photobacterium gaetbulicola Gung47]PSU12060.1 hypothetical protein C9J03_10795 [Photobacterium gaetbulicola]WEM43660.1 DUF6250 domain-containing protein [Photobacterium sp. DA100]